MTRPPTALSRAAQAFHAATAAAVWVGLIWQFVLVLRDVNVLVDGDVPGTGTRIIRFFSYFTVESNILVAVTATLLAIDPDRGGKVFRVLRLEGLFGITVTGIVYSTLLRGIVDLHGAAAVTNALLHYAAPLAAVFGWLLFGPRPRITDNTLMLSLIWPVLYIAYSFAHGAASDWYPYPFIDVVKLGYVTVIRNGVALNLLLVGVGALFGWLDRRLPASDEPNGQSAQGSTLTSGRL